jgi:hypothetical protein
MATEKWVAGSGVGLTWTAAYSAASTFNSIVNGNAIISDLQIDNSTALDIFADFAFVGGSVTTVAPNYIGVYLYPLNSDGSTYGDSRFGTSAAGPPPSVYYVGSIGLPVGTQALTGMVRGIILPPAKFKFLIYNQAGVTLAGSGANTILYRTYNRSVA